MPVRFVDKYKESFTVIIEADEGFLLGGRTVDEGVVFDTFSDALNHMNAVIEDNVLAYRKVRLGAVVEFKGLVSHAVHVPARPVLRSPIPD